MRRVGLVVAGLVMAATVAWSGGVASAAKVKPGATWTIEVIGSNCEQDTFASNGTFTTRPTKQYSGSFGGTISDTGQLVKGAVASFDGYTC